MRKIKLQNTHIHLTDELRGNHLTNRCLTANVRVNGFYLKGWRGETWLDVKYKTTRGLSKVEMYQGDNAFEIDIILNENPLTNVFVYKIRTKGLNFWYQPPLTKKEIEVGYSRPKNVEGSYAVYHKTKKHNFKYVNGSEKNYKTGKFCHIYRPQAFDSNGKKVWCNLNIDIDVGIMTIIVPQDFLDNATYPVRIDPEFGHKAFGASSLAQNDGDPKMFLNQHNDEGLSNVTGTMTKIFWYGYATFGNTINVQMAAYDKDFDGDLQDSALAETSNIIQIVSTVHQWHEHIINLSVISFKIYMIGVASNYISGSPSWAISVFLDSVEYDSWATYNLSAPMVFSNPLGLHAGLNTDVWSLYGEYEESIPQTVTIISDARIVNPRIFTFANPVVGKGEINPYVFDIKLKHVCNHNLSNRQYTLNTCPRCLGTGYYYDVKFNEMGRLIEISLEDKLQQALEKLILTDENKFHEDVAIGLKKWLGEVPISKIKAIIKYDLIEGITALKDSQKSISGLSPRTQISSINDITVTALNVDSLHYIVTIATVSGEVVNLQGVVNLSDILI